MALPVKLVNFCLEKVRSFSEYLPYVTYHEGFYHLIDNSRGMIFECRPLPGAGSETERVLSGLFSIPLPVRSTIQVSLLSLPVSEASLNHILEGRVRLQGLIRKKVEFLKESCKRYAMNDSFHAPARETTVLVSVKVPSSYKNLPTLKKAVRQLLEYAGLLPREVEPERLLYLLYRVLNPAHPDIQYHWDPTRELRQQIIFADNEIIQTEEGLLVDGWRMVSLSPKVYPATWHLWQSDVYCGDHLVETRKLRVPFMVTLNWVAVDQIKKRKEVQTKATITTNQLMGVLARIIPKLRERKEHYDIVLTAIEHGNNLGYGNLNFLLWGPEHLIHEAAQTVESHMRSHGFILQRDNFITANMLLQSLPLSIHTDPSYFGPKALWRGKTMLASNFAALAPVVSDWKGTKTPVITLFSRRGELMSLDLFDNIMGGQSGIVAGRTGSGKSFFINELILNYYSREAKIWMIDVGRSYLKLCDMLEGEYIEFDPNSDFSLNPFSMVKNFNDEADSLKSVIAQMASPSEELSNIEMSILSEAIQATWDKNGNDATMRDLREELLRMNDKRASDLAQMLYDYTDGMYARHFNSPANVDFTKDFVVLELEGFSTRKRLRSVVLLLLMYNIQSRMYGERETVKLLLIDEAWDLFGEQMANTPRFIEESYRRVRKYKGSIITITQSLADYDSIGAVGKALLQNADFYFLLAQNRSGVKAAREHLDEAHAQIVEGLRTIHGGFSEIFIRCPIGVGVARLVVDRFFQLLYTSRAEEFSAIEKLKQQGLTTEQAIEYIIENLDRKRESVLPLGSGE